MKPFRRDGKAHRRVHRMDRTADGGGELDAGTDRPGGRRRRFRQARHSFALDHLGGTAGARSGRHHRGALRIRSGAHARRNALADGASGFRAFEGGAQRIGCFWPMATSTSTGQARGWWRRSRSSGRWFTKVTVAAPRRGSYTQGKSTRLMASRIVKGLTVAAGMGLAIGIGSGNRRTEENSAWRTKLPDDGPEAGPIAARLDRIEARISAIEAQQVCSRLTRAGSRTSRRFTRR